MISNGRIETWEASTLDCPGSSYLWPFSRPGLLQFGQIYNLEIDDNWSMVVNNYFYLIWGKRRTAWGQRSCRGVWMTWWPEALCWPTRWYSRSICRVVASRLSSSYSWCLGFGCLLCHNDCHLSSGPTHPWLSWIAKTDTSGEVELSWVVLIALFGLFGGECLVDSIISISIHSC